MRPYRVVLLAATLTVSAACAGAPPRAAAHDLVGTWRVVRYEVWDSAGTRSQPLGTAPVGYGVFDGTRAFIQLMSESKSYLGAYFGPYAVRGAELRITVEGTNIPDYMGSVQVRRFRIAGDTMTLGMPGEYQATTVRVR